MFRRWASHPHRRNKLAASYNCRAMSAATLRSLARLLVVAILTLVPVFARAESLPRGIFTDHQDVGTVIHPGSVDYDTAKRTYTIAGSGENMWFGIDDFHFAWKKVSGDAALTADIAFLGAGGNPHRKAVLMLRQSLDGNSSSVDIAVHGVGLTSLQYRDAPGSNTHEVESHISAPKTVRIEKRGDFFYAFVSGPDEKLHPAGAATKLTLSGDFYIGIGVCSHDKDAVEKAVFSNVVLETLPPATGKTTLISALETISVASTDRRVEYVATAQFEAPNWSRDGKFLVFNQDGTLRRLALDGSQPVEIPTAPQIRCNNDHGISPDGQFLALSDASSDDHKSRVYVVPITGGTPRLITTNAPSYWHGWSPDGKTLAFTGQRGGPIELQPTPASTAPAQHLDASNFDVYSIPVVGGDETRLTNAPGLDDGPEYSPDGAYIYFNSERTGHMQIWRMKTDGSDQEQVTSDDSNDWFPHLAPDGQSFVFLAYESGVAGHPPNKNVELRLMSLKDHKITVLAKLFGGQGTINVPSWSPDGQKLALVSYEEIPVERLP